MGARRRPSEVTALGLLPLVLVAVVVIFAANGAEAGKATHGGKTNDDDGNDAATVTAASSAKLGTMSARKLSPGRVLRYKPFRGRVLGSAHYPDWYVYSVARDDWGNWDGGNYFQYDGLGAQLADALIGEFKKAPHGTQHGSYERTEGNYRYKVEAKFAQGFPHWQVAMNNLMEQDFGYVTNYHRRGWRSYGWNAYAEHKTNKNIVDIGHYRYQVFNL